MSDELDRAVDVLRSGGLVAYPTDTYYGLGADGLNAEAVERVFAAKGREQINPVPLLLADVEMMKSLVDEVPAIARTLAEAFWPGPLTIVLRASVAVPEIVTTGTRTVGVRVPDHEVPRSLARMLGRPITGTSANRSGDKPCRTAAEVTDSLGDMVDFVIEGECGAYAAASTVVDCSSTDVRIVREGALAAERIFAAAGLSGRAGR